MSKILIVDDEIQFLEMVQMRLESKGYEVILAVNGKEGLEKARTENPDLILLDVMMPKLDGLQVCKLLKNDERCSQIPIIICTAMAQTVDLKASQKVKADAYIAKPFDHAVLLAKIEELLKTT